MRTGSHFLICLLGIILTGCIRPSGGPASRVSPLSFPGAVAIKPVGPHTHKGNVEFWPYAFHGGFAISPDGKYMIGGETKTMLLERDVAGPIATVEWDPEGHPVFSATGDKVFFTAMGGDLYVWDANSGLFTKDTKHWRGLLDPMLQSSKTSFPLQPCFISPGFDRLIGGTMDGEKVLMFDGSGTQVWSEKARLDDMGPESSPLVFSHLKPIFAMLVEGRRTNVRKTSGGESYTIVNYRLEIHQLKDGALVKAFEIPQGTGTISLSGDGAFFGAGAAVYSVATGQKVFETKSAFPEEGALDLDDIGGTAYIKETPGTDKGEVHYRNLKTGQDSVVGEISYPSFATVRISADGRWIAIGSASGAYLFTR